MGKQSRSKPLTTIKWRLFLIPLAYVAVFTAYRTRFHQWTTRVPNHLEAGPEKHVPKNNKDSQKHLLGRLLGGDERLKLETTQFACDNATHVGFCVANQQVRIDTANLKVYMCSYNQPETLVRPYPSEYIALTNTYITPVRILKGNITKTPESCHYTHLVPVIVFSSGIIGNIFHEISEIIIPLFLTSRHFQSSVQFIVTDYHLQFVKKYNQVLKHLSNYQVIRTGSKTGTHCFPGAVIGLKYHDHLALDPESNPKNYTILHFKQFLRESYSLKFKNAGEIKKPVLLLVSRKDSRVFVNENEMVKMMKDMGFQVIIRDGKYMSNLDVFSKVINSCNVMIGAHGAGLTNMVFLPEDSVYIQVIPYALKWPADTYYGRVPATKMGLKYMEYNIVVEESSLIDSYGPNHTVITDPGSIHAKGYEAVRSVYLSQNMTIDLSELKETLVEALDHLGEKDLITVS
ncbi:alpha-1,3-arabinosyltransferase XAT2-like [Rutidosis leptorrhynchoides]|uniref:alpha-1,3-arabinosyltransferase XAT2-like n=1 Tax=Rutidosis leptorrhynchoides TaxID=125765 RepID=UPI003A9907BA